MQGKLSQSLALTHARLSSEMYVRDSVYKITLLAQQRDQDQLSVEQNVPNPFRSSTMFKLECKNDVQAVINVSDLNGHRYVTWNQYYTKGNHSILIDRKQIGAPGMYLFEVITSNQRIVKKMILLE